MSSSAQFSPLPTTDLEAGGIPSAVSAAPVPSSFADRVNQSKNRTVLYVRPTPFIQSFNIQSRHFNESSSSYLAFFFGMSGLCYRIPTCTPVFEHRRFFHVIFKLACLFVYTFCGFFGSANFVMVFVLVVLLSAVRLALK
jgi:hypothetical protein